MATLQCAVGEGGERESGGEVVSIDGPNPRMWPVCVWNSIEFIASVCFAAPELNCPQCVMVACVCVCVPAACQIYIAYIRGQAGRGSLAIDFVLVSGCCNNIVAVSVS